MPYTVGQEESSHNDKEQTEEEDCWRGWRIEIFHCFVYECLEATAVVVASPIKSGSDVNDKLNGEHGSSRIVHN